MMQPKHYTNLLSGLCWISARLTGRGGRLLDLAAVTASCTIHNRHYAGIQTVPIEQIRGSEGRCNDFDANFHLLQKQTSSRWQSIESAQQRGVPLPPVELICVGDVYFVRDGHHRISVAAALGQQYIDAEVIVWQVDRSLAAEQSSNAPDLRRRGTARSPELALDMEMLDREPQRDLERAHHPNALIAKTGWSPPHRAGILQYTLHYARCALSLLAAVGFGIALN
jgi:hypothetical protein